MLNLILHLTLPAGLALTDGRTLDKPVTFDVLSACHPFYASVDQVRLSGGPLLNKAQDITVACQIYNNSQECDLMNLHPPGGRGDPARLFYGARNQWVQAKAACDLLLGISTLAGGVQSHVLANFSFVRGKGFESEGTPERIKDLKSDLKLYEKTIRSGGRIVPGGFIHPVFAAKGVNDWEERTPSRTWVVTGMGANSQTVDGVGLTGGRGKSLKFYASPLFMGPMSGYRFGIYQSGSPLSAQYPYFGGMPLASSTGVF